MQVREYVNAMLLNQPGRQHSLLPLIKEGFLLIKMISLFDRLAQRPKCFKIYDTKNPKLFQDTPDLAEDFDSRICLACIMAKKLQWLLLIQVCFPPIWCFRRFPFAPLIWNKMTKQDDKASFFVHLWLVLLSINLIGKKGLLTVYLQSLLIR